tara:strand:+ start:95 stop:604 length:510 start_codon:yes stop_codon:yes gene_type:complete
MLDMKKPPRWIAIYTKSRHEKTVADKLNNKGFEVYLPTLKKRRNWSDRKKWIDYPLFKSYLFVRTKLTKTIFISKTPGIVKIIRFGNNIATVDNNSINAIKLMLEGGYNPESTDYFIKGDLAKVIDGPLKGVFGEVARIDGNDRLIIRIDCIQHSISIKIKRSFLRKKK